MICTWYEVRAREAKVIWGSARAQIRLVFKLIRVFCAELSLAFVGFAKTQTKGESVDPVQALVSADKPERIRR